MPLTQEAIEERVVDALIKVVKLPREQYTMKAKLQEDLGYDSLDLVETMYAIEDAFGLELSDEEAEKARTVGNIVSIVQQRVAG